MRGMTMASILSRASVRRWWIVIVSAATFTTLAVIVDLGLLSTFDSIIREWARPNDVWGTAQLRADYVVEGLRPPVLAVLLALFTLVLCVIRRSMRPAVFVGGVWLITVALTVVVKMAVGRPDTHGVVENFGGSFPSGHTISVIVCIGLAVAVVQRRVGRWVWLIPALVGGLMGVALMIQAAHWSTDVMGGALLATGVLVAASTSGWRQWSHGPKGEHQGRSLPDMKAASSLTLAGSVGTDQEAGSQVTD
jgi:membrane-associated phospholipid phosphatase